MELTKVNEWVQLVAAVAVLAGLGLIAVELRQNSDLTRAELISETMGGWSNFSSQVYGEDIANTIAKAYENPKELTTAELIQLDHYMWAQMGQTSREILLQEMGMLPSWSVFDSVDANLAFGSRFAQSWYMENKDWINVEITEFMDQHMQEISPDFNAELLARIKSRL